MESKKVQTPLEVYGLTLRDCANSRSYYKKGNPYAELASDSYLRTNHSYVAASGWRPSTFDVVPKMINDEYSNLAEKFNVQTGGDEEHINQIGDKGYLQFK